MRFVEFEGEIVNIDTITTIVKDRIVETNSKTNKTTTTYTVTINQNYVKKFDTEAARDAYYQKILDSYNEYIESL